MSPNERAILGVVISTGISSVVVQLVTIREFLALLQGNEFVIALILFSWFTLGGIGTRLAQRAHQTNQPATRSRLSGLSLLIIALAPIHLLAIRIAHRYLFVQGVSVGFYPTLGYILLTVAPYTLLIGYVLPYSLFVLRSYQPGYPGARVYIFDNLGDVIGGALFAFFLVFWAPPFRAILWANLPLLICATRLVWRVPHHRFTGILGCFIAAVFLIGGILIEPFTLLPADGQLVWYRESRYGRLAVHQSQEQYTFFRDGIPLFSTQNQVLAEETIHYPLSQVPNPDRVLLLSYESGALKELEKYTLTSIDYVEVDPEVTLALQRFKMIHPIQGLNLYHQDGRSFLAATDKIYDAIIINLPEPDTFQTNRFYTDQFFALARAHLRLDGVLSFSMSGFDNYLDESQRQKISSLYNTAHKSFAHVQLLPGQRIFFLCRNQPVTTKIPELLVQKRIAAPYIQGFYHGDITTERIDKLNALIDPQAPINQDLFPRLIRLMFAQWFTKFATSPTLFVTLLLILTAVYGYYLSVPEFVLFSTGFMTMGSEILVIFAFQIFFGYIYFQIGLIVTVFLAGLLPGAWLGQKFAIHQHRFLAVIDGLLIGLLTIFILMIVMGGHRLPAVLFLLFGFCISLACGFQFPVALQMAGGGNSAVTRTFAADLIGAACGTLVTSLLLIPSCGVIGAAAGLILLKLSSLLLVKRTNG
jgi:spermidine synthase